MGLEKKNIERHKFMKRLLKPVDDALDRKLRGYY